MARPNPLHTHAALGPLLTNVFEEIRLGASLVEGENWHSIHSAENVVPFEFAHGGGLSRHQYNVRSVTKVRRAKKIVMGKHAGFHDLFAPVDEKGELVVVTGPFLLERPSAREIAARWRSLSGVQARITDPEFAHYLAATLATTTFDPATARAFSDFIEGFCALLGGRGDADRVAREAQGSRQKLARAWLAERTWKAVDTMVDERFHRNWHTEQYSSLLPDYGVARLPEHALVGFLSRLGEELDPIEDSVRRDALFRAGVELGRKLGRAVCGRIGDHGLVLLVEDTAKAARLRSRLLDVAERARGLARRFGYKLHVGIGLSAPQASLPARHQSALAAAEKALSLGSAVAFGEARSRSAIGTLGELRRRLVDAVNQAPEQLPAHFDRYLDAVAAHCGYRLEPTRAHVEAGLEQVVAALDTLGALDERSQADLRHALERAADAGTVRDFSREYRRAITDLARALVAPKAAHHDRSMRRALDFIREHFAEAIDLKRVSRVAGFAPGYFSKLFAKSEQVTFQHYVQKLRVDHARELLERTSLGVERIGRLSGFGTRTRFHLAFKEALGVTPAQYRKRAAHIE